MKTTMMTAWEPSCACCRQLYLNCHTSGVLEDHYPSWWSISAQHTCIHALSRHISHHVWHVSHILLQALALKLRAEGKDTRTPKKYKQPSTSPSHAYTHDAASQKKSRNGSAKHRVQATQQEPYKEETGFRPEGDVQVQLLYPLVTIYPTILLGCYRTHTTYSR